jgi:hypothetical protein
LKKEKEKKESNPPIKPTRGITLGWVGLDRVRHASARGTFLNLYCLTFSRPISLNRPYQAIINVSFAGLLISNQMGLEDYPVSITYLPFDSNQ